MVAGPGLNVLVGRNAQGKTSLLESVALLARGRSFRTEQLPTLIRRGAASLTARATVRAEDGSTGLEVHVSGDGRRLRVDGREVEPRRYHGRLEVVVYSTDRLRVVRGPMRERRLFLDRAACTLWPTYAQCLRDYERVVQQRNAALVNGHGGLPAWDEQQVAHGAELRRRRGEYVARLRAALRAVPPPAAEDYDLELQPRPVDSLDEERRRLEEEIAFHRPRERHAGRSLAGPHRDAVVLRVDGEDASQAASSGQARSLLLVLAQAMLELYRQERGQAAVALLDDLDSELDEERATAVCAAVARHGQAWVTTAHPHWARRLGAEGRVFAVEDGEVRAA
jgi:DNA replication and repair protein RecF